MVIAPSEPLSIAQVWDCLHTVPDPEIPVISVTDLGIVRAVKWDGNDLLVTVTPTYSGCPATAIISLDISTALQKKGVGSVKINMQLSPPWTTDWLTESGRAKLLEYGIAPPSPAGGPSCCPQCGSSRTEKISQFGSTPCKAAWRCMDCLEPFDYFKCI
jgi:ring-1,2-phenylacetyl-CoA epoxidase subunit PaaD